MCGLKKLFPICCLLPILAAACASGPAAGGPEKLHGKWTNDEYFGTTWDHEVTWYPEGRGAWYANRDTDSPTGESRFQIEKKWTDRDGSTWYRYQETWSFGRYNKDTARRSYALVRVNAGGDSLELERSSVDFPSTFGALGGHHFVYHRAQGAALLQGSWVNRDLIGQTLSYKLTYRRDGSAFSFAGQESDQPSMEARYHVRKTWTDAQGATWLHVFSTWGYPPYNEAAAGPNKWYGLVRISADGATLEISQNQRDFPAEFGDMGSLPGTFQRE